MVLEAGVQSFEYPSAIPSGEEDVYNSDRTPAFHQGAKAVHTFEYMVHYGGKNGISSGGYTVR